MSPVGPCRACGDPWAATWTRGFSESARAHGDDPLLTANHAVKANDYAGALAVDRLFNDSRPDFQLPARAVGYQVLFDYPRAALGAQTPGPNGEILVEGTWYCTNTPAHLIGATLALLDSGRDEAARRAWVAAIDARTVYQLSR